MSISVHEVRRLVRENELRFPQRGVAVCETYFSVGLAVFSSLKGTREDKGYWKAVGHALRMKSEMCRREMNPGESNGQVFVPFGEEDAQVLISVFDNYIGALSYVRDIFTELPRSEFTRTYNTLVVGAILSRLKQEREQYVHDCIVKQFVLVARHRFSDLDRWSDMLIEALAGSVSFATFCKEFNEARLIFCLEYATLPRTSCIPN